MTMFLSDLAKSVIVAGLCVGSAVADVDCGGIPTNVRNWEDGSGYLGVTFPGTTSVWVLCSNNQTLGNVTPTDCKAILATLLTALAAQRQVDILFGTYTDCASVPSFDITLPGKLKYVTAM
jgi:hypothetical protein